MSEAQTIVTGETREAFMNHRMGLSEPVKEAVIDEPIEAELEAIEVEEFEEEEPVQEPVHEEKKPNSKIEKRFQDLTKQREEARSDASRERAENEALKARLASYEEKKPEAVVDASAEPKAENYQDAFDYARDLAKWSANDALANRDKEEQSKRVLGSWNKRLDAVKLEVPEYDTIIANSDVGVSDLVRDAIIDSEVGPKILLHLAQNPDFTKELGKMTAAAALKQIGRLEAKYETVAEPKEPSKPVVKISKSAEPISPIRGGRSLDIELSADGEFTGSFAAYSAARKAGKLK